MTEGSIFIEVGSIIFKLTPPRFHVKGADSPIGIDYFSAIKLFLTMPRQPTVSLVADYRDSLQDIPKLKHLLYSASAWRLYRVGRKRAFALQWMRTNPLHRRLAIFEPDFSNGEIICQIGKRGAGPSSLSRIHFCN
jgi:hypothetical protein